MEVVTLVEVAVAGQGVGAEAGQVVTGRAALGPFVGEVGDEASGVGAAVGPEVVVHVGIYEAGDAAVAVVVEAVARDLRDAGAGRGVGIVAVLLQVGGALGGETFEGVVAVERISGRVGVADGRGEQVAVVVGVEVAERRAAAVVVDVVARDLGEAACAGGVGVVAVGGGVGRDSFDGVGAVGVAVADRGGVRCRGEPVAVVVGVDEAEGYAVAVFVRVVAGVLRQARVAACVVVVAVVGGVGREAFARVGAVGVERTERHGGGQQVAVVVSIEQTGRRAAAVVVDVVAYDLRQERGAGGVGIVAVTRGVGVEGLEAVGTVGIAVAVGRVRRRRRAVAIVVAVDEADGNAVAVLVNVGAVHLRVAGIARGVAVVAVIGR